MEVGNKEEEIYEEEVGTKEENDVHIFVNVLTGVSSYKPMRVKGMQGKGAIFILIDSGSTHNFIDAGVAEKLGCKLTTMGTTKVTVADGSTLNASFKVEGFKWNFQNVEFDAEFMVIPLSCCDIVLGIQWLATLGLVI